MTLEFLLLAFSFVLGLVAIATVAYALRQSDAQKLKTAASAYVPPQPQPQPANPLLDEVRAREEITQIENKILRGFERNLLMVGKNFTDDLAVTCARIKRQLEESMSSLTDEQTSQYKAQLAEYSASIAKAVTKIETELESQQAASIEQVREVVHAKEQKVAELIDAKLADIVSAYILESLGSSADSQLQLDSVLSELERKKAEIKRDLLA